jgi:hypothetical protein
MENPVRFGIEHVGPIRQGCDRPLDPDALAQRNPFERSACWVVAGVASKPPAREG